MLLTRITTARTAGQDWSGMSDLIDRQDVLDVLRNLAFDYMFQCGEYYGENERRLTIINARKAIDVIESLPTAEPERKKGKWMCFIGMKV